MLVERRKSNNLEKIEACSQVKDSIFWSCFYDWSGGFYIRANWYPCWPSGGRPVCVVQLWAFPECVCVCVCFSCIQSEERLWRVGMLLTGTKIGLSKKGSEARPCWSAKAWIHLSPAGVWECEAQRDLHTDPRACSLSPTTKNIVLQQQLPKEDMKYQRAIRR